MILRVFSTHTNSDARRQRTIPADGHHMCSAPRMNAVPQGAQSNGLELTTRDNNATAFADRLHMRATPQHKRVPQRRGDSRPQCS